MFWNELIMAYEADVAALEAARRAYGGAADELMGRLVAALASKHPGASVTLTGRPMEILGGAQQVRLQCDDESGLPFVISVWVASIFGGPPRVLRVGAWLDAMPEAVLKKNMPRAVDVARSALTDASPGAAYDAEQHRDAHASVGWLRIASLPLADRSIEAIERDVLDCVAEIQRGVLAPASTRLGPWVEGLRALERVLLSSYDLVQRHAAASGGSVATARAPLPIWREMPYVQWTRPSGNLWLAAHVPSRSLLLQCDRKLAMSLQAVRDDDSPIVEIFGYPALVVANAEAMDPQDALRRIDALLDRWSREA